MRFSEESVWDATNPWNAARDCVVDANAEFDIVFLSGTDWRRVIPEAERPEYGKPVVNLVQSVRHACTDDPLGRHKLLAHKAIRICVSPDVERAILSTGRVNGPVFRIPNGIDVAQVERMAGTGPRDLDVLVAANKDPELGASIARRLEAGGHTVHLSDTRIPREELMALMGRAQVSVLIPRRKEGFYLPAIEAMAAGTVVVCPDCIGNRGHCIDGENSFRPAYEEDAIVAAAERALAQEIPRDEMLAQARATARAHDLATERRAFLEVLDRVPDLWTARLR